MKLAAVLVALGSLAYADGYKMSKYEPVDKPAKACRGDMDWRPLLGFGAQAPLPKAGQLSDPQGDKDDLTIKFTTDDYFLALRFIAATGDDLDFKKSKARIEADAKKSGHPIKWTRADKTSDGYALVYSEVTDAKDKKAGTDYMAIYLRTIGSNKIVCWNETTVSADASTCAAFVCEQVKAQ